MEHDYLTLAAAAKLCPGKPHCSALWRWSRHGLRARNGERVRLKHIRVGGRIFTTRPWLNGFFAAVAEADVEHFDEVATPRTSASRPAARRRQIQAARRTLRDAGI